MGATEEQMLLLSGANIMYVSYILLLYSIAFLLFLFVCLLLHLYAVHALPVDENAPKMNGTANGHAVDGRLRDAEEFELEGLMSEDEEGEEGGEERNKKENAHAG